MEKHSPAAGIVLIKYFDGIPKVLGLMDNGMFDLTKGAIDPGETIIAAALRETEEESGITLVKFVWGLKTVSLESNLVMFIAETNEEPKISPNPETGELEHQFAEWLDLDLHINSFKPKLRPAIEWAKNIVMGGKN